MLVRAMAEAPRGTGHQIGRLERLLAMIDMSSMNRELVSKREQGTRRPFPVL